MTAWTGVMKRVLSEEVVVSIEDCEAVGGVPWDGDEQDVAFFAQRLGFVARCVCVVCVVWWVGGEWVCDCVFNVFFSVLL